MSLSGSINTFNVVMRNNISVASATQWILGIFPNNALISVKSARYTSEF
jgi:hypothetical protein